MAAFAVRAGGFKNFHVQLFKSMDVPRLRSSGAVIETPIGTSRFREA